MIESSQFGQLIVIVIGGMFFFMLIVFKVLAGLGQLVGYFRNLEFWGRIW